MISPRVKIAVAFGAAVMPLVFGAVLGQEERPKPSPSGVTIKAQRIFQDASTCGFRCHSETKDLSALTKEDAKKRIEPLLWPLLIRFNEVTHWKTFDKHSRAYDALTGPRGAQMGRLLKYEKPVTESPACLSCHSTGFLPQDKDDSKITGPAFEARGQGVNCIACHGPYNDWLNHGNTADTRNGTAYWRTLTPQKKSELGMYDLRDPAVRARVCNSCHVGNEEEGKVVTHAMYAAGHPPLPGIELVTFERSMPPHWMKASEVPYFKGKSADVLARYHADRERPVTSSVLAGGVGALLDSLALLAGDGGRAAVGREATDFARLECSVCHHDLQSPGYRSPRQAQWQPRSHADGSLGRPGRPQFRAWPLALARVALRQAEAAGKGPGFTPDEFERAVDTLRAAFDAAPLGDPEQVAGAAKALRGKAEALLKTVDSLRLDSSAPRQVLAALAASPASDTLDYDSARQIAWAVRSVAAEWAPSGADAERFKAAADELGKVVKLDPDATGPKRAELIKAKPDTQPEDALRQALVKLSEGEYQTSLLKAADYDPAAFQAALGRLAASLSGSAAPPLPRSNP